MKGAKMSSSIIDRFKSYKYPSDRVFEYCHEAMLKQYYPTKKKYNGPSITTEGIFSGFYKGKVK